MDRDGRLARLAFDPVRLALVVAGILLLQPAKPTAVALAFGIGVVATLIASARWDVSRWVVLGLFVGGIALRLGIFDRLGSDVLLVTTAAIERVLDGGNPYGVGYEVSNPPGAPFPYGPAALLWYLPVVATPRVVEVLAAVLVLAVLALQGRVIGLAVYAVSPILVATTVDGSNDTTLGILLLGAFALADRRPLLAAMTLAVAAAFKLSALAWLPAFVAWAGWRAGATFGAVFLAAWLPAVFAWGAGPILHSLTLANSMHAEVTWSLGSIVQAVTGRASDALNILRYGLGALAAVLTVPRARSLDAVILSGTLVYVVTLFSGTWATYAYVAAIAPLICWRLDDWLRIPPLGATGASEAPAR